MKILHRPDIDYISIDFKDEIEAKSYFENGLIIREDKKGNVIGLDITDSSQFFSGSDTLTMKEACALLKVSESTMRRYIKLGKVKFKKPNGKDYRFRKMDILKIAV
jgi:excisionase family DNA binding protein